MSTSPDVTLVASRADGKNETTSIERNVMNLSELFFGGIIVSAMLAALQAGGAVDLPSFDSFLTALGAELSS